MKDLSKPKTQVILSPNHYEINKQPDWSELQRQQSSFLQPARKRLFRDTLNNLKQKNTKRLMTESSSNFVLKRQQNEQLLVNEVTEYNFQENASDILFFNS
jgi:hypothetical protein